MKKFLFTLCWLLLTTSSFAARVAVLETGADGEAKESVSFLDRQYLTNVLREQAVKELPAIQNWTIMTRENIQQMLPPGKAIEECEGSCLVETGKNISADYVCQARVGLFGKSLTLSAELYETAGNKLIASFNGRGQDVEELLELIKQKAPGFFRSIKSVGGFAGMGGIGDFGKASSFSFAGKKKYIVEISSTPAGAVPTVDGKAIPKCLQTPCKIQIEEGSHRIVASLDEYDDAESVVDIKGNNQKIELSLQPNYGWLEIKPVIEERFNRGALNTQIDGKPVKENKVKLEPGIHEVQVTHPCYDPVNFKVSIAKNKVETFDQEMARGVGGLELNAEFNGDPQVVAVFIDGEESGSTPYVGEVPLCANVTLKGEQWTETVHMKLKWHEVVRVLHRLSHSTENVAVADANVRVNRRLSNDELNKKNREVEQIALPNVNEKKPKRKGPRVVPLSISAAATVAGVVLAVVENNKAKETYEKKYSTSVEFQENRNTVKSAQEMRSAGIGLAILGAVGLGLSFVF